MVVEYEAAEGQPGNRCGAGGQAPGRATLLGTLLSNRDFRLLAAGETVSLIGDQFYLLALPWLVLQTTGSALAIGTVTGVLAVPRAVFMLFAGVATDRLSPRVVMLWSNLGRMALVAAMAVLVLTQRVELWMVYGFALGFGTGDAFYFPALNSAVPRLLPPRDLLAGNAVVQGANQLAMFAGPVLAGNLIAAFHMKTGATRSGDLRGVGAAFGVDALTFLVSACVLLFIHLRGTSTRGVLVASKTGVRKELLEGLRAVHGNPFLRSTFPLLAAGNFLVTGPLYVGLPVLARARYQGGAGALGLVLSAFGAGSLTGVVLAGAGRRPADVPPRAAMALCPLVLGCGLVLLGIVHTVASAALIGAAMGLAQGYLVVRFMTFVQHQVRPELLGRVISLLTFVVVGISPLSSWMAGAFIELSVSRLLLATGGLLILVVGMSLLTPAFRRQEE